MAAGLDHAKQRRAAAAARNKARAKKKAGGSTATAAGKVRAFKKKIKRDPSITEFERKNMAKSYGRKVARKQAKKANYQHEG
tara:strand:+ start:216 stop:461 length:246 start_codon:yes stop_codon:yes gene_type:complete